MSSAALTLVADTRPHMALIHPVLDAAGVMQVHNAIADLVQKTLVDGKDFGVIPGTNKPSLYKSGAERLCVGFGLVDTYEIVESEVNHMFENPWEKRKKDGTVYKSGVALGLYCYTVKCLLRRREDNQIVAEGVGYCSSLETKYCDRPRDVANTILKMAKKRAKVDATLSGLGLSDRFTQDVEDQDRETEDEHGNAAQRPTGSEVRAAAPKASAEKLFPFSGPFKDQPIGAMPIHAIEGYVEWIYKKQEEKSDPTFFEELVIALNEVLAAKRIEAEKDQIKMDLGAEGDKAGVVDAPQDSPAGTTDPRALATSAPSAASLALEEEDQYPDGTDKLTSGQLRTKVIELLKHPAVAGNSVYVAGTMRQIQPPITIHQLRATVRTIEAMIASAPVKGKGKQAYSIGTLPGGA